MNKLVGITLVAATLLLTGACSHKESSEVTKNERQSTNHQQNKQEKPFEITSVKVKVVDDKSLTGSTIIEEDGKEKEVVPVSLYYDINIKRINDKNLITSTKDNMDLKIIPDQELLEASKKAVGVNLFDKGKSVAGFGVGAGFEDFNDKGIGKLNLSYDLGASTKTKELPMAPSKDKIKILKENSLKGTLIVIKNKKEIGRYDLKSVNKID